MCVSFFGTCVAGLRVFYAAFEYTTSVGSSAKRAGVRREGEKWGQGRKEGAGRKGERERERVVGKER